jgi:PIN domain nuclease of toxin-antitoxin system
LPGILLDTHALYWLVSGAEELSEAALVAIGENQENGTLFVSPITAWELSLASLKPNNAPQLGNSTVAKWFRKALQATSAKIIPISQKIALAAADVVSDCGHKDPGDCYLVATARTRKIPLVTRDGVICDMAATGYLNVVRC